MIVLSDTVTIDSNIDSVYYSILDKAGKGDFDSAVSQSDDLLVLLNKRALITQNVQSYSDKIALLRQRRDELSVFAGESVESVTTQFAGYFYSQTDGFEGIYSSAKAEELQLSDYDVICNSVSNSSLIRTELSMLSERLLQTTTGILHALYQKRTTEPCLPNVLLLILFFL